MTKIQNAVAIAIGWANDNKRGYSQSRRNGGIDKDCSKMVLDSAEEAGINIGTATYTGDMLNPLLANGFIDVVASINTVTGRGLAIGDILLRPKTASRNGHTAYYIGNGKIVQANADYDGKLGDSSGKELCIAKYYNSGWPHVLRYVAEDNAKQVAPKFRVARVLKASDPNMVGEDVRSVQAALNAAGFNCGKADGNFGDLTGNAVNAFQLKHPECGTNGKPDGKVGKKMVTALGGQWTGK